MLCYPPPPPSSSTHPLPIQHAKVRLGRAYDVLHKAMSLLCARHSFSHAISHRVLGCGVYRSGGFLGDRVYLCPLVTPLLGLYLGFGAYRVSGVYLFGALSFLEPLFPLVPPLLGLPLQQQPLSPLQGTCFFNYLVSFLLKEYCSFEIKELVPFQGKQAWPHPGTDHTVYHQPSNFMSSQTVSLLNVHNLLMIALLTRECHL